MAASIHCITWIAIFSVLSKSIDSQITVSVVSVINPPYLIKTRNGNYTGFLPELLDNIAHIVGFDYTLYESPDNKHGFQDNGIWGGMMKEIIDGNADIAGPLTVTSPRARVVDFSYPFQYANPAFVMKKPIRDKLTKSKLDKPPMKEDLFKLLYPLDSWVWLMTAGALLVTSIVLYIISYFNPYEWRTMVIDGKANGQEAESFTCLNTFFFVVSTLMWQGYVRAPRSVGGRVLVVAWWSFTVLFLLTYTASLINYFRYSFRPRPAHIHVEEYSRIENFSALADSDNVRVGVLPLGATNSHFKHSQLAADMKIYSKIVQERRLQKESGEFLDSVEKLEDYLRQRQQADYAVLLESPASEFITNKKPCDLYMVNDETVTRHLALAIRIGSPLKEPINLALLMLRENRRLKYIEEKWFSSRCEKSGKHTDTEDFIETQPFQPVDLRTFSLALLIILAGVILGGIISVIEFLIYKRTQAVGGSQSEPPSSNKSSNILEPDADDRLLSQDSKKGVTSQV